MAYANHATGLKIAVAFFMTVTVIQAVVLYFLYSAYSRSEALLEVEREQVARLVAAVKKSPR